MRGYGGASIARPRHDTPPEGQSRATYKGTVKWLISLAISVHEMCHAGDQPGGDSRLLGGKARDISSQAHNITPVEVVEVPVPVLVLESLGQPPQLPDHPHRPLGHQPQQPAATLVPRLPKPMCRRTSYRCGASRAHVNQSMGALG
ncbi:hypothetical protein Tco_1334740 [Tanacetum coccineum]